VGLELANVPFNAGMWLSGRYDVWESRPPLEKRDLLFNAQDLLDLQDKPSKVRLLIQRLNIDIQDNSTDERKYDGISKRG
jgi:hypothetical protein